MNTITVSYKVGGEFGIDQVVDRRLTDLAEEHGGESVESGSGFGLRDLEFEFGRSRDAKLSRKEAKKIVGKNSNVSSLGIHELVHLQYWEKVKIEENSKRGDVK